MKPLPRPEGEGRSSGAETAELKSQPTITSSCRAPQASDIFKPFEPRNARRRCLVRHLHEAGPRPVLEALIAVEKGQSLDDVLDDFGRIPVSTYHAFGASELPITQPLVVVKGGRDD